MGAFEHVISLLSFVYALAIAHLLTTVARLIASRERVRFSSIHAFWMVNALLVLVVDWISFWDMRALPSWTMANIALVLVDSFTDYLQAALVCPEIPSEGKIDLVEFHKTHARRYIGAFAVTGVMALLLNLHFGGGYGIAEFVTQNFVVIPLIVIGVVAAAFRQRRVQIACPFLLSALWVYYLVELQSALQ